MLTQILLINCILKDEIKYTIAPKIKDEINLAIKKVSMLNMLILKYNFEITVYDKKNTDNTRLNGENFNGSLKMISSIKGILKPPINISSIIVYSSFKIGIAIFSTPINNFNEIPIIILKKNLKKTKRKKLNKLLF